MKNSYLMSILLFFTFIFSGCAPTYNIKPEFNVETESLTIINTSFDSAKVVNEKILGTKMRGDGVKRIKDYKIYGLMSCNRIHYEDADAGARTYFSYSKADWILDKYEGGTCYITQISNLRFFSCRNTVMGNYNYNITAEKNNSYGYQFISRLALGEGCFNKIKEEVIEDAKKNDYEITNTLIKKGVEIPLYNDIPVKRDPSDELDYKSYSSKKTIFDDKIRIYEGTYTFDSPAQNVCSRGNKVRVEIDGRDNLRGKLFFNKDGQDSFVTNIVGNSISFNSENIFFDVYTTSKDSLEGVVKDKGGCRAEFNLTLKNDK